MKKNYYAKVLALTVAASMVSVPAFAEEGDGTAVAASVKNADTSLASEEEGKGTEVTIDKGEYADLVDITASVVDSQVRLDVAYHTEQENPMAGIYYTYELDGETVEGRAIAQSYIKNDGNQLYPVQAILIQQTRKVASGQPSLGGNSS